MNHHQHQPLLLPDLRRALGILYSLDSSSSPVSPHHPTPNVQEAHDFLLKLQSRNVRRRIQSQRQRERDQPKAQGDGAPPPESSSSSSLSDEYPGSTWIACLALLCTPDAHSAERLFAAQTLLHRVRRTKLPESIDLELENPEILTTCAQVSLSQVIVQYVHWMHPFHPLLGSLMEKWMTDRNDLIQHASHDNEAEIKGELTMLTLAAITYLTALSSASTHDTTKPLVFTLASALAVTALRLRYTPQSVATKGHTGTAAANSTPLVTMVTQSLTTVTQFFSTHNQEQNPPQTILYHCLCACIAAIPDAILGSPGGARGRLSIDPRCIQAAHDELKCPASGVSLLWDAVKDVPSNDEHTHESLLAACERFAKFLPLPLEFVRHTVPLAQYYLTDAESPVSQAAWAYLVSIYEAGSWTPDHILSFSLGLSADQMVQPANKKRQSSKSKKRQKELVESNTTDVHRSEAEQECQHRGEAAVVATELVWERLATGVRSALTVAHSSIGVAQSVGCLCACANACLPHLLQYMTDQSHRMMLETAKIFQEVCSHPSRTVRALAYEPLFTLHDALLASARRLQNGSHVYEHLESLVVDHLVQCSLRLATSCAYPQDYFADLSADNNEELEIERNDVRDVLRTVAGSQGTAAESQESPSSEMPLQVSVRILDQLVNSCANAIAEHSKGTGLPPETAVHALSALAKPLNQLAFSCTASAGCPKGFEGPIRIAMRALGDVCGCLVKRLPELSVNTLLPVSRLACMATASFAPMLSVICVEGTRMGVSDEDFRRTMDTAVHAAALSIVHIPELAAESTLDHTIYDIVGAMRGPGGEDHVGILALMRLAFESDQLALATAKAGASTELPLVLELCKLYSQLKSIEDMRQPGIFYGKGVTPKSRRILLRTTCHLAAVEERASTPGSNASSGAAHPASFLRGLLSTTLSSILALQKDPQLFSEEKMFRLCEEIFDLASFSPDMVSSLFNSVEDRRFGSDRILFINGLIDIGRIGYYKLAAQTSPEPVHIQWGRLRGALLALLRASSLNDVPPLAAQAISVWSNAECEAICAQCDAGPSSASSMFNDSVISESLVPAGAFVHTVGEVLGRGSLGEYCLSALEDTSGAICLTILHSCPEPAFVDPRPTLCEAWFMALASLSKLFGDGKRHNNSRLDAWAATLLSESCCTALLLLLNPCLDKTQELRTCDGGMSLDGPQSRAIMEFLENYFLLGGEMLHSAGSKMFSKLDVVYDTDHCGWTSSPANTGVAILGAVLLRGASGGLPPWAIEGIPALYSALFQACGADPERFAQLICMSMEVRLAPLSPPFRSLRPRELISGRYVEAMKDRAKSDFVDKARELSSINTADSWRRFKVSLKSCCGGKKKGAGLSLKPSFTNWDCDRI